ncbi:TonB-dependent receptor domain-containing protein, partial [Helicobacter marmotae]
WLTFKAGIATGVLVPQLSYTFDGVNISTARGATTSIIGNPNLKPEQSYSYELSAIMDFEPAMLILTGYYTNFKDKIQGFTYSTNGCANLGGASSGTCTAYDNVDKSMVSGAEASLKVKPIYGFGLDTSYGFTYTRVIANSLSNGVQAGDPVSAVPKHKFTIKPTYRYKNFDAYIRWSGNFKTPVLTTSARGQAALTTIIGNYYKDYQLVDLALNYKFLKNYTLSFAVNNLFNVNFLDFFLYNNNTSYENNYQRILPSRNYWISLRAEI